MLFQNSSRTKCFALSSYQVIILLLLYMELVFVAGSSSPGDHSSATTPDQRVGTIS